MIMEIVLPRVFLILPPKIKQSSSNILHFEIKTKIKKNSKKTPAPANHKDSEDSLANIDLLANCDVIVCVFQNICMFIDRICLFVGKIKRPPL